MAGVEKFAKQCRYHQQPFAEVLNKIVGVLDTIMWIITSIQQAKPQIVCSCFIKCGFSVKIESQDSETEEELTCLWSGHSDFLDIENQLEVVDLNTEEICKLVK